LCPTGSWFKLSQPQKCLPSELMDTQGIETSAPRSLPKFYPSSLVGNLLLIVRRQLFFPVALTCDFCYRREVVAS
jgi:hypothetical protein